VDLEVPGLGASASFRSCVVIFNTNIGDILDCSDFSQPRRLNPSEVWRAAVSDSRDLQQSYVDLEVPGLWASASFRSCGVIFNVRIGDVLHVGVTFPGGRAG